MSENNTLDQAGLRELAIVPGAVFLGPWADIDHEKNHYNIHLPHPPNPIGAAGYPTK